MWSIKRWTSDDQLLSILVIFVQHFSHVQRLLVAKYEIWGAIWVSVAKFGHFVSILHQFESHFCQFWSMNFRSLFLTTIVNSFSDSYFKNEQSSLRFVQKTHFLRWCGGFGPSEKD